MLCGWGHQLGTTTNSTHWLYLSHWEHIRLKRDKSPVQIRQPQVSKLTKNQMTTVSIGDVFPGILSVWRFKHTWYPDTHGTTDINSEHHPCIILFHCLQELVMFLGLLGYHFYLGYHYCSMYNLFCLLSLSLCLSYFLSCWISLTSSELLGFYMKWLTF